MTFLTDVLSSATAQRLGWTLLHSIEALAAVERRRTAALAMAVGGSGPVGNALGRVRRVLGICDEPCSTSAFGGSLAVLLLILTIVGYAAIAADPKERPTHASVSTDRDETDRSNEAIQGRVLDHTGKPVVGAVVYRAGSKALEWEKLDLWQAKPQSFSRPTVETDEQGRFTLSQSSEQKNRLVITSASLALWAVPLPKPGKEAVIRLPRPATVRIRCDIPGAGDEVGFHFHMKTWEMEGWKGLTDSRQYTLVTVANPGETVLGNLTPGSYDLARKRDIRVGDFGMGLFCDHRDIALQTGETAEADWLHQDGQPIVGQVVGLKDMDVPGAFIFVKLATTTVDRRTRDAYWNTIFDALTCEVDGQFKTAHVPPGEYKLIAQAYGPDAGFSGERLPDYLGMASVTVRADDPPVQVRIDMKPRGEFEKAEKAAGNAPGTASGTGQTLGRAPVAEQPKSFDAGDGPALITSAKQDNKKPFTRDAVPRKLFAAGHGEDVNVLAVAFSPNGKVMAVLDQTAKVILRDAGTGGRIVAFDLLTSEEKELVFHSYPIRRIVNGALAFSPDGKTLAVGADPVVRLYEAETARLKLGLKDNQLTNQYREVRGHSSEALKKIEAVPHAHGRVHSVAFSPDGTMLATSGQHVFEVSGATPGHLKLWDPKTGKMMQDLGLHFGAVRSAAFTPDGKILAGAGVHPPRWTSSIRFWDPQSGAVKGVFESPRGDPWSIAFSPDGQLVAVGGIVAESANKTSGVLLIWHTQTCTLLLDRALPTAVTSVAFSTDGETLASGEYDQGVTLWDVNTLKATGKLNPIDPPESIEGPVQVVFSPNGNLLAAAAEHATQGGIVAVWALNSAGR